ncbi:MAG: carboxypeptidase regulatory-like domain-containing protein [Planctomycetes bacterium]|nr:carboxypeptidase regulatory-like domain-containing protein [Planctomycetota bacterium]
MLRTGLLALAATAALTANAAAQFCSDNTYKLHLVTANGTPLPTAFDPVVQETTYLASNENVYLAFDPLLPSGTYYVHVTDNPIDGFDQVLSQNDPLDRFVSVTNTNGVITLSLPFTNNNTPAVFGQGLNGQGMSIRLSPFSAPTYSTCRFKAWFGDNWDLSGGPANPYLLAGGLHPQTNQCSVRSYEGFRIGDGNGSDVTGLVFLDSDRDGVRDAGEGGLANWSVQLTTGTTSVNAVTDSTGAYTFPNVAAGEYTVQVTVPGTHVATNATSHSIEVCECADVQVLAFGAALQCLPCNARTIGYWRNCHGLQKVVQYNILPTLPALGIVNQCGQRVAPGSTHSFRCWIQNANAWNMAYMLSAQLTAMHCNVMVGFVHPNCVIKDPCLGTMTIAQLMQQSVASLLAHPYTPPCSAARAQQTLLKNALDRANNNRIWF